MFKLHIGIVKLRWTFARLTVNNMDVMNIIDHGRIRPWVTIKDRTELMLSFVVLMAEFGHDLYFLN